MEARTSSYPLIPVDEALDIVLKQAKQVCLVPSRVELSESLGKTLAEDVIAPCDLPQFPASMKDGYCLSINPQNPLKFEIYQVVDTILAGKNVESFPKTIEENQVYKIMTGAPIPQSCNTVVMIEDTSLLKKKEDGSEHQISINKEKIESNIDVRHVGSDIRKDEIVLKKGETIGPSEIGLLASCGISKVFVFKAPQIGILSTGDEIIDSNSNEILQSGQIYDSNRPMLFGLLKQFDSAVEIHDCGIVKDESENLCCAILNALKTVDILITSGGVSMGEVDLVKK